MAHERGTSVSGDGRHWNVYGPGTGRFPQPLPPIYGFERPSYATQEEADRANAVRSMLGSIPGQRVSLSDYLRTNPDRATLAELMRRSGVVAQGPPRMTGVDPRVAAAAQAQQARARRMTEEEILRGSGGSEADYAQVDPWMSELLGRSIGGESAGEPIGSYDPSWYGGAAMTPAESQSLFEQLMQMWRSR
jgi:hypothetical protein